MCSRVILTVALSLVLVTSGCSEDGTEGTATELSPGGGVPVTDAVMSYGDEKDAGSVTEGESGAGGGKADAEGGEADTASPSDSGEASADDSSLQDVEEDAQQGGSDNTDTVADSTEGVDTAEGSDALVEDVESSADAVVDDTGAGEEDTQVSDTGTGGTPETCDVWSSYTWPEQSGVVYVAHYASKELRWYRIDGESPYQEGVINTSSLSHGSALDPVRNLLAVAYDVGNSVELFELTRPQAVDSPVPAPVSKAVINLGDYTPRTLAFDAIRGRLYVVTNAPVDGLLTEKWLHVYDVTTPASPKIMASPQEIPVTVSIDVDPYAGILGLVNLTEDTLHLYDAREPTLAPLAGEPLDLQAFYPQTNTSGFQVRGLKFDTENGRILAARAQGALSEVIAFGYPTVVGHEDPCSVSFGHGDLQVIEDGFDVDQAPADWDNLLSAYAVLPIPGTDQSMFVADAWSGSATAAVFPLNGALEPQTGCGDYAGTGCFYQSYYNNNPGSYERTDGAACLDGTHGVVVGTSVNASSEDNPGGVHFFRYQADLSMEAWIPADGGGAEASGLPIGAECH